MQIVFFLFLFCCGFCAVAAQPLRFGPDGTFKIVQFTDLHYGELPPQKDVNSSIVQVYSNHSQSIESLILSIEKPDLVVLTGDMVSGYAWDKTSGWYEKQWNKFTKPFIDGSFRWVS